jgi:class 3 adenylate cyclase
VVGEKKFAYDVWGDTVNVAARMEAGGETGRINISASTYELVRDAFHCTHRGKMNVKHDRAVDMYFVETALDYAC